MKSETLSLLQTWADALLAHQIHADLPGLKGGLLCPACARVHGRCGDAVYPLLLLFRTTGETKYLDGALQLFDWSAAHASWPDGSWANEVSASGAQPWKGISCFSVIALGEALRHHGDALPAGEREKWRRRLRSGADFLMGFADVLMAQLQIDINYPISVAAALASSWAVLGEARYHERARELAHHALDFFTENGLLWGEGTRDATQLSPRGLHAVDLGYNVEESLPNLALYGTLCGDEQVLKAAAVSLRAHLEFLLPDGGWDGGWGSRQFKWAYWGSRTSDGCAGGCLLLRDRDERFAEAAARNLQMLAACTHDGLLYGGPHLHTQGVLPCIHHTFCHAKGLASAWDAGIPERSPLHLLREEAYGVREFPEIAVHLISVGPWRATVSAYDTAYHGERYGQPGGGALSLLWHENAGLLSAASMNRYWMFEAANMQPPQTPEEDYPLTLRLELFEDGVQFSNVFDALAQVSVLGDADTVNVCVTGHLVDHKGTAPKTGPVPFELSYRFDSEMVTIEASVAPDARNVALHFPLVSRRGETAQWAENRLRTVKEQAYVELEANGPPQSRETGRVFNFVPGLAAIPLQFALPENERLRLKLGATTLRAMKLNRHDAASDAAGDDCSRVTGTAVLPT